MSIAQALNAHRDNARQLVKSGMLTDQQGLADAALAQKNREVNLQQQQLNASQNQFNLNRQDNLAQQKIDNTNKTKTLDLYGKQVDTAYNNSIAKSMSNTMGNDSSSSTMSLPNLFGDDSFVPKLGIGSFTTGGRVPGPDLPSDYPDNVLIKARSGEYVIPKELKKKLDKLFMKDGGLDGMVYKTTGQWPEHGGSEKDGVPSLQSGGDVPAVPLTWTAGVEIHEAVQPPVDSGTRNPYPGEVAATRAASNFSAPEDRAPAPAPQQSQQPNTAGDNAVTREYLQQRGESALPVHPYYSPTSTAPAPRGPSQEALDSAAALRDGLARVQAAHDRRWNDAASNVSNAINAVAPPIRNVASAVTDAYNDAASSVSNTIDAVAPPIRNVANDVMQAATSNPPTPADSWAVRHGTTPPQSMGPTTHEVRSTNTSTAGNASAPAPARVVPSTATSEYSRSGVRTPWETSSAPTQQPQPANQYDGRYGDNVVYRGVQPNGVTEFTDQPRSGYTSIGADPSTLPQRGTRAYYQAQAAKAAQAGNIPQAIALNAIAQNTQSDSERLHKEQIRELELKLAKNQAGRFGDAAAAERQTVLTNAIANGLETLGFNKEQALAGAHAASMDPNASIHNPAENQARAVAAILQKGIFKPKPFGDTRGGVTDWSNMRVLDKSDVNLLDRVGNWILGDTEGDTVYIGNGVDSPYELPVGAGYDRTALDNAIRILQERQATGYQP